MALSPTASLSDPAGSSALVAAVQWVEGTMLGSVATAVAVIAVAAVGFLLLTGRIDLRRAATVIAGCFLLFGASSIAAGLSRMAGADASDVMSPPVATPVPAPSPLPTTPRTVYDPYAGASVPPR